MPPLSPGRSIELSRMRSCSRTGFLSTLTCPFLMVQGRGLFESYLICRVLDGLPLPLTINPGFPVSPLEHT